jgi:GGDEF domain-containing protein
MFGQALASLDELVEASLVPRERQIEEALLEQAAGLQQELGRAVSAAARRPEAAPGLLRRGDSARTGQRPPLVRPLARAGGETALTARAAATVERCRSRRCPLSLVLATVDNFSDVLVDLGPEQSEELVRWLARQCCALVEDGQNMIAVGEARFAILFEDCDRLAAAASGWKLLDAIRRYLRQSVRTASRPVSISLGVATVALPPRNFSERQLIEGARRCLQAAQTSGGDTVKSIEI